MGVHLRHLRRPSSWTLTDERKSHFKELGSGILVRNNLKQSTGRLHACVPPSHTCIPLSAPHMRIRVRSVPQRTLAGPIHGARGHKESISEAGLGDKYQLQPRLIRNLTGKRSTPTSETPDQWFAHCLPPRPCLHAPVSRISRGGRCRPAEGIASIDASTQTRTS